MYLYVTQKIFVTPGMLSEKTLIDNKERKKDKEVKNH